MDSVDSDWQPTCLGNHVDLLTGFPFKSAQYTDHQDDVKLLRGDNVVQGKLRWDGVKRWPKQAVIDTKLTKYVLKPGDVVLAMDRPWIEAGLKHACICDRDVPCLLVQRVSRLRGTNGLLTGYLRYLIGSLGFSDYIKPIVTGVAVPHISPTQIKDFKFRLPPMPTQRKIAAILSAYDDLIENNTHRIKILEEMAQAIYREWFVNFRFPGHEKVGMVESELGLIPEGWEVRKLGDVAKINALSVRPNSAPAVINYIDISSVSPGRVDKMDRVDFAAAPGRARRVVKHGDTIWSTVRPNRRSYALILAPEPNTIVSTGFAVVTPNGVPYTYLYHALTTDDFAGYLSNRATGSAYPAVLAADFENATTLVPSQPLLDRFHEVAAHILLLAHNLQSNNHNLRQTRDLLLPKLVSGEVDVAELEIGGERLDA